MSPGYTNEVIEGATVNAPFLFFEMTPKEARKLAKRHAQFVGRELTFRGKTYSVKGFDISEATTKLSVKIVLNNGETDVRVDLTTFNKSWKTW